MLVGVGGTVAHRGIICYSAHALELEILLKICGRLWP